MRSEPTPAQRRDIRKTMLELVAILDTFDPALATLVLQQLGTTPESIEAACNP